MDTQSGSYSRVREGTILDLKKLEPGDIILSRPASLESAAIAFFGASRFSHAQLVVPDSVRSAGAAALDRGSHNLVIEATTAVEQRTNQLVGGVGLYSFQQKYLLDRNASRVPRGTVALLERYVRFEFVGVSNGSVVSGRPVMLSGGSQARERPSSDEECGRP